MLSDIMSITDFQRVENIFSWEKTEVFKKKHPDKKVTNDVRKKIHKKIILKEKNCAKLKKVLAFLQEMGYYIQVLSTESNIGLSPNGKATDSDSVISRFESL